jgi:D-ribose pyranose/furanose isomerase RbsD
MGHGDVLLVVDAGFPIPRSADRIDLAVARDLPDLRTVLRLVHAELIVERVLLAGELSEFNPLLDAFVRREFAEAELEPTPHAEMLSSVALRAKTIVRTGAFDPWGNIGLVSGVDVGAWFSREGVTVPEAYRARFEAAAGGA